MIRVFLIFLNSDKKGFLTVEGKTVMKIHRNASKELRRRKLHELHIAPIKGYFRPSLRSLNNHLFLLHRRS